MTTKFRNSSTGLLCVFALTGFMGGFLMVRILVAFLAGLGAIFLKFQRCR